MVKKILIPLVIFWTCVAGTVYIFSNPVGPEPEQRPASRPLSVEVATLAARTYTITLPSYGTVRPRIQGELVTEIAGRITFVSENFTDGGFFEQDELLLKIDPADYEVEVKIAEAELIAAQQGLVEEQLRLDTTVNDGNRLGGQADNATSALVLPKPQLEIARANVTSAQAKLRRARLALQRTVIRAPYKGRVLNKQVEIAQVVNARKVLATTYAIDTVEIRLPLKNTDLKFIDLPETEGKLRHSKPIFPPVTLYSDLLNEAQTWSGHVVRTEGAIDDTSQQLHVIAQIKDPFAIRGNSRGNLKIGQYLNARITGRSIENALVIPSQSIYQGSYVYIVENGELHRRDIQVAWQNDTESLLASGLQAGQTLVLTPLGQVTSGTKVSIITEPKFEPEDGFGEEHFSGMVSPGIDSLATEILSPGTQAVESSDLKTIELETSDFKTRAIIDNGGKIGDPSATHEQANDAAGTNK